MGRIVILGSAFAVPGEVQENTHFAMIQDEQVVLVDTASSPIQHLRKAGIEFDHINDIILTHFHPDHVSGVPLLLMGMWLLGRKKPLHLHGLNHTLERVETLMDLYDWGTWPNFYPVFFHRVDEQEKSPLLENDFIRIVSSPVQHLIPTIGIRAEFLHGACTMAYSCDTEPCDQVVRLADGADILIHEASGASIGHTSASQAAEIAVRAKVKSLYLIHYPTQEENKGSLLEDARKIFPGPVQLATDFMTLEMQ
jgi:ribonuclease Z